MSRPTAHADVFQAIADPTRRQLLSLLLDRQGETTATELAAPFLVNRGGISPGVTQSAISQHLKVLREANLVTVRVAGRERRYRLNADPLKEVAEWVGEYERFWTDRLSALSALLTSED